MNNITNRPDPNAAFPNPNLPRLCFIKNVVKNPRIIIGDYTYYDDVDGADQFEKHVTHFYDFIGDKLIIGKFCAIAKGIEFVMTGDYIDKHFGDIAGKSSVIESRQEDSDCTIANLKENSRTDYWLPLLKK